MGELRNALGVALGFPGWVKDVASRTLGEIRGSMLNLLGYGAMPTPPPGVAATLNEFINEAQQALARRLELDQNDYPDRMESDDDLSGLSYQPILTLAMAMACAHYAKPESKAYFEQHEKYVSDTANRQPPGLMNYLTGALQDAQRTLLRRFPTLRLNRYFSWPLTAGVALYDFPDNQESIPAGGDDGDVVCDKKLDPLSIKWVGVVEDGRWRPLVQGIAPELHSNVETGLPLRFDFRQCIEIWPAPSSDGGELVIQGDFKIEPFADDEDTTSIDDHAVYLLALANAKAHYKQPDAQSYVQQLEVYIRGLVAGAHGLRRYVPGAADGIDWRYTAPKTVEALP